MNILNFIINSIFRKKEISQEIQIKKAENPVAKNLSPQTKGFSAFIKIQKHKFEFFLN